MNVTTCHDSLAVPPPDIATYYATLIVSPLGVTKNVVKKLREALMPRKTAKIPVKDAKTVLSSPNLAGERFRNPKAGLDGSRASPKVLKPRRRLRKAGINFKK